MSGMVLHLGTMVIFYNFPITLFPLSSDMQIPVLLLTVLQLSKRFQVPFVILTWSLCQA